MSSLLQNVLASRLAQATLGSGGGGNESGTTTASSSSSTSSSTVGTDGHGNASPSTSSAMPPPSWSSAARSSNNDASQSIDEWERVEQVDTSDDELVGVVSQPGTVPGTPHISRPPSPGGSRAPTKRSALSKSQTLGTSLRKSKTDPLRSLPKEVAQRIFLEQSVPTLISLSMVNRRYRRSATLNYCWYRQCHKDNMQDDIVDADGGAKWTRRASKMDWKTQYAKQKRIEAREQQRLESLPGSGTATPSRTQRLHDEGYKTASDVRQEEWQEQESQGYSKEEMREWYKSQGGSKGGKLKGKRAKGGAKTGADDGSLWN